MIIRKWTCRKSKCASLESFYLPVDPHVWNAVVDLQVAVKVEVEVVVLVTVLMDEVKASKYRPLPSSRGTWNPGWTM